MTGVENYNKTKKVTCDGETFDSKDEVFYYKYLIKLKSEEKILYFERGEKIVLIPKFTDNTGKTVLGMTYTPDFIVGRLDGTEELVEIKGFLKEDAGIKIKMLKYKLKDTTTTLTILSWNLKWGDESGFIGYNELKKIRAKNKRAKA